jgi:signal transduction histidine kinase/CheY-like chemotaxis protein
VPAIEAIGDDPQELRRNLRDLVAVSILPAVWRNYSAQQIAESLTEVLVRMLGLEFAYMSVRWGDAPEVRVARTRDPTAPDPTASIRSALGSWLDRHAPSEVVTLANPLGSGSVRLALIPIAAGEEAAVLAGSCAADFPSAAQRLLLEVTANQAAIAIRRWQAEHALQRLNETLEERVATEIQRRIEVEEAFRQAQKMEAVGQLTGGVAHDFNNLLSAVLGNLKLLRKRLGDHAAARRLIDGAIEGAERGASLTQRLLAFARQQDLHPAAVDVGELIYGMLEMLRRSIGPLIQVEPAFGDDLWVAHVDANQLELAVLNLVVNARDAMPEGGHLTLAARNVTLAAAGDDALPPGDYVCLVVGDTGAGMDGATLAHATEPFFTTKGAGKGTGLGLSMVHGLAAQSGGALRLSSRPGAGTTAELWLPRARVPPARATAVPARMAPQLPPSCAVLVVDDDVLIGAATGEMLKDLGHRVIEAASGSKALEILRAGTPIDVVVSDEAMPGMRGTELAAEIRASWPDLPVILATGYAELPKGSPVQLPILRKPYAQEDLAAAIVNVIGAKPSP